MSKQDLEYCAQVIVEKTFATPQAAENWMARVKAKHEATADDVETRLWTGVKGTFHRRTS